VEEIGVGYYEVGMIVKPAGLKMQFISSSEALRVIRAGVEAEGKVRFILVLRFQLAPFRIVFSSAQQSE